MRLCAALLAGAPRLPDASAFGSGIRARPPGALQISTSEQGPVMSTSPLLEVSDLHTSFTLRRDGRRITLPAVAGVSFEVARGEVLGIVGESGCGKTTVGRSIMRLTPSQRGQVRFDGIDILQAKRHDVDMKRLNMRMVFQDPYSSLNPRRVIGDSIAEAGDIHHLFASRSERFRSIEQTLVEVGLDPSFASRFPHELSGGQRQRVGIARAILPRPDLMIADEPVSALDVSIQAQVINLLADLRERLGLSIIFISHDLGVVGQISDRVAVMYMGRIVETGPTNTILRDPQHPYTRKLMAARPRLDPSIRIKGGINLGEPPSRFQPQAGCAFAARCSLVSAQCRVTAPALRQVGDIEAACHNI
jgi:oligopeptide/dipeptide ABC transporter ATP-binding protein